MTKNSNTVRKAVSTSNLQSSNMPGSAHESIAAPAEKSYTDHAQYGLEEATRARRVAEMEDPMRIVAARGQRRMERDTAEAELARHNTTASNTPRRPDGYGSHFYQTPSTTSVPESSKVLRQDPPSSPPFSLREMKDVLGTIGRQLDRSEYQSRPDIQYQTSRNFMSKNATLEEAPAVDSILSLPSVPAHNPEPIRTKTKEEKAAEYTTPFTDFLTDSPTVFHTVAHFEKQFTKAGYKKLSERDAWKLEKGGKYFLQRNGSSAIAFSVGDDYEPGNGAAMIAGHIDALTTKLKPIPKLRTKAGYVQLGVAPYAGALNNTWWDRDLSIGGKVLVKDSTGKVITKLVKLNWPIARIPTLAPHFGAAANGPFNQETQMVPIVGLDNTDTSFTCSSEGTFQTSILGGAGSFASTQPERLVKAIAGELKISDYSTLVNWELELYDYQPATTGGLEREFIFAGRIDDKLCSWSAVQAHLETSTKGSSILKVVALFDDEEIGSLLRQGARGNFLPSTVERIVDSFASPSNANIIARTYANSFLVSSDVTHAVNPNFLPVYLENHAPRLNVGVAIAADSNGHMTTDSVSTAILQRVAEKSGQVLQVFQIRNDSRSGGTVGPMLSSAMGVRAVDAGLAQLSMHSIRATVGSLDPGLGVLLFKGFFDEYESVDKEFRED